MESVKSQLKFFGKLDAWLIIAIVAIGTGGLFCWISYISPLLTEVSHFDAEDVPYILILAGLGMVVGNFIGGGLADRFFACHHGTYHTVDHGGKPYGRLPFYRVTRSYRLYWCLLQEACRLRCSTGTNAYDTGR